MNYLLVLLVEFAAYISIAFAEAEVEGKYGGGGKNAKIFRLGPFAMRKYHVHMNIITIPLFISIAWVAGNFDYTLLWILIGGGLLGGLLQDFVWFLVNPHYGIKKFNSKDAYWLRWWKFGKFEIPYFYIMNPIIAFLIWFVFL